MGDKPSDRFYMRLKIDELRKLLEEGPPKSELLDSIKNELTFRSNRAAKKFGKAIEEMGKKIGESASKVSTPPQPPESSFRVRTEKSAPAMSPVNVKIGSSSSPSPTTRSSMWLAEWRPAST